MDATGAGTSTGQTAGSADVTESAGDITAGPSRPAGRADATGPLPVPGPADPTGPIPAPQAASGVAGPADPTAAQPTVPPAAPPASVPSWFETGPLPVIPTAPDGYAPDGTGPNNAAPPDVAAAPPAGGGDVLDAGHTPPVPSTPPAGLFEPAIGGPPAVPAPPPPSEVIPSVPAGVPAHAGLFTPATPAAPPPPTAAVPSATAATPPAGLFAPAAPPGPAAPAAPEPPTGVFAAAAPPPAPPPAPPVPSRPPAAVVPSSAGFPAAPADATGLIPTISAPPAAARPEVPPAPPAPVGAPPAAAGILSRAPEAPPRPDAWAFGPAPTPPPRNDRPSNSDDRRRGPAQSWPLPTPAGGGHSTSVITTPASPAATPPKKRRTWPLTVVGVLVAVAAGIALVFSVARTNPADLAGSAAKEVDSWPGAHYKGAVAAIDGGEIRFDLTVSADGASGTLSRDGGRATAELLWDQGGALVRANREWWLYHHPTRANDLAGAWVAEPLTETQEIDSVLRLDAAALARQVRGEPSRWQALEQQLVEGRPGIVLSDGSRRIVVGSEDAHPLLAVDVAPEGNKSPVPVSRPTDEEIVAVVGAATRVRQESAPKTLAQLLQERPSVGIQLDPRCTAETCDLTVTLTNSGSAPARGRLEIKADGQVVANHPLDVPPGQVATFTATAPNPQFGRPDARGPILWQSLAIDD
jgi:hypothetical protein